MAGWWDVIDDFLDSCWKAAKRTFNDSL